jgi:hypothetical protein
MYWFKGNKLFQLFVCIFPQFHNIFINSDSPSLEQHFPQSKLRIFLQYQIGQPNSNLNEFLDRIFPIPRL